ncbi:MAG: HAMP domain-containing protein [Gammaproteobacteria bacterium]|nr:MAG: HAMP domain-containing protein [Gammaproteobacteria bacterium]
MKKFRSVRQKFIASMLLITVVALLVSGSSMVVYNLQNYYKTLINDLTAQVALLGKANTPALQFDDPQAAQGYLSLLEEQPKVMTAAIYNARGALFAAYSRHRDHPKALPPIPGTDGSRIEDGTIVMFKRIVANNEILGTVYLQAKYNLREKLLGNLGIALTVFLLALIVALLLTIWLQASVTRPILAVSHMARQVVERRDYSLRAQKTTHDEIGSLVDAVNAMLSEVEQRNQQLENSNRALENQVAERSAAEKALRESRRQVLLLNTELEQRVQERTLQLESANKELEAFSYSVSHDLRAPLRAIDGFSQALLEDYNDHLDDTGRDFLGRVRAAAQRMGHLIDDMLKLSRVSRAELQIEEFDLSEMASSILAELQAAEPERKVKVQITSGLKAFGDKQLLNIALQNLLQNAWKYTGTRDTAEIEFGMRQKGSDIGFFVQDNGVGFDMQYADKLFGAFQRLHDQKEFPGTGIGLATVKRIINRHGGEVWVEAELGKGAAFYFTLPITPPPQEHAAEVQPDEHETDISGRG